MIVAVEGCAHGSLDEIYEAIRQLHATKGIKVDLLLCCGDFQVFCWFLNNPLEKENV